MNTATKPKAIRVGSKSPNLDLGSIPFPEGHSGEHFVQFYESGLFLQAAVARFLGLNLQNAKGRAMAIATPENLAGIAAEMASAGLDVAGLVKAGRYVPLEAGELLGRLMQAGKVSEQLFDHVIGSLVEQLSRDQAQVAGFGEMVSLLWKGGKQDEAVELEKMWNRLRERLKFTLMCGYAMEGFADLAASEPFLRVCQSHSVVLPTEKYLAPGPDDGDRLRTIAVLQQRAAVLEQEVAERRRAEAKLRRREAELTAFVETATVGLHWLDQKGVILWANSHELELLGYSAAEYIGRDIRDFIVEDEATPELLARLCRGEVVRDAEAEMRCRDGTIKTVVVDSRGLWDEGRLVHSQCFTRDVTVQRRNEMAGRFMQAIVDGSDDAIVSKNLDGIITSWNSGAQRIFGYTSDEAVGRPIMMLIPEERAGEEFQILAKLRRGERVDHFETVRKRKDGSLVDISVTISPIRNRSGKVVGASKIARDISDRKRSDAALEHARQLLANSNVELERRIQERTASLRDAVAQMEEFSYTVSHDLRAPLRGMQVYSQALLEDYGGTMNFEAQHCLTRIAENAMRLDKMVTDVLTFSRLSGAELHLERVEVDKLVRDIVNQYPSMQPPNAELEIAPLHAVHGHEPSLTQIISNLLGNAVKFVAPGVRPRIRVWTELTNGGVRLFIRDNGIGIRPAQQKRLFQMFERMHPDLPYEGTGVGLAIVRKAANRMGGEVGVISEGAGGATFWVQVPAPLGTV
jgi:PAS domain S-box-containing protein